MWWSCSLLNLICQAPVEVPVRPTESLAAAVVRARALGPGPRSLVLAPGRYFVEQPITLTAADSQLTIAAAPGATVELIGGRRVADWTVADGLWSAPLPAVADRPWDFRALIVAGAHRRRARLPREGTFLNRNEWKVPWMSTTGGGWQRKPTPDELTTMLTAPGDLPATLDARNAEVTVYHMWDESLVGVSSFDPSSGTLRFSSPAGHPPGAFSVRKYVVWNTREGLTEPGQWYLDRPTARLYYRPLPGEDPATTEVLAPTCESIIRLQGTPEAPVRGVTLRDLRLSVTTTPLVSGGFGAGRFDGAVTLQQAAEVRLSGLQITNTGGQGVKAANTTNLTIERCRTQQTGACGLTVRGDHLSVADCTIAESGVLYPSAIAVSLGGSQVVAEHNQIHHCPYSALTFGGTDCRLEANLIHHAMQELHDGAGIYITFCKRVTVRGNVVRDIADTGGYGASSYYLDEQAEDCLVENNLSLNVVRASHNHMARNNILRNNVFCSNADLHLTFPKSSGYTLERNVLVAAGQAKATTPEAVATWTANLLQAASLAGLPESVQRGDPQFVDALADWTFRAGSPALALGIQPLRWTAVGPR
ncbi:MAG: right-handed parallel beta-helix repeat-containing protein [Fimbriimonadaceae bacterium]|nr:right-handed parallel beta-helix repeat-containing protein [Fimbriimonadaceae bacterium]